MLTKKKKLSKKEIQEDKLVTYYYNTMGFYEKYQKYVLAAAAAIVVIIVAIVLYSNSLEQSNIEANTALSRTIPVYESGSYREAIDGRPGTNVLGFKEIADEYDGTDAGEIAKMYLANSYYFLGDYENAIEAYDDYDGDIELFAASSLAGKAASQEAMGNFEEAAESYRNAYQVSDTNPSNSEYMLSAGINYLKAGDKEAARESLENLKNKYQSSSAAIEADKYIAQLQI